MEPMLKSPGEETGATTSISPPFYLFNPTTWDGVASDACFCEVCGKVGFWGRGGREEGRLRMVIYGRRGEEEGGRKGEGAGED